MLMKAGWKIKMETVYTIFVWRQKRNEPSVSAESEGIMREYKFRGRRIDTGEWAYGYLLITQMSGVYIIGTKTKSKPHKIGGEIASVSIGDVVWQYEVDPDTVGQCTWLKDKNGREIYEGDVLRDSRGWEFEVRWDNDNGRFLGHHSKARGDTYVCYVGRIDRHNKPSTEVIGNIHDNSEPLQI